MNRVILNELDKHTVRLHLEDGDEFTLSRPSVCEHITGHLKAKLGQVLKVTLLNEALGEAKVTKLGPKEVTLKILNKSPTPRPKVTMIIGACRPPTVKKILEHGSAFGVDKFIFFQAALSEKSYLTSKVFEDEKTYELLTLGLSQGARHCHLPQVRRSQSLEEALSLTEEGKSNQKFYLSLREGQTFLDEEPNIKEDITLTIGPERGWTQDEERILQEHGLKPIVVGPSILRVEMAIFSALGQLAMLELTR